MMKTYPVILLAVACLCSVLSVAQDAKPMQDYVVGEEDMRQAVTLASGHVKAYLLLVKRTGASPYRVIAAQNLLQKGVMVWLVTFKPADLIPKEPGEKTIGVGGEIFVTVDLTNKKCVMRHGE